MSGQHTVQPDQQVRNAVPGDFGGILRLNTESEHFLSPLSLPRLEQLHAEAACHRVVATDDGVTAFLLAFREGCSYDSPNYRWFSRHFDEFLYIDRIAVSAAHQGRGLGGLLYADLFDFARRSGVTHVTCEYDVEPPNDSSRRFHSRFGFTEVGTQRVGPSQKLVSLQVAVLRKNP